jgi:hypothetical protein
MAGEVQVVSTRGRATYGNAGPFGCHGRASLRAGIAPQRRWVDTVHALSSRADEAGNTDYFARSVSPHVRPKSAL